MISLHSIKPADGSTKNRKRIGRGQGSGRGGTSTKGHKGAQSRSGYSAKRGFEGGQMPLQRRVPKFGFKNPNRVEFKGINLDTIQILATKTNSTVVDFNLLFENGLVSKKDLVKILNRGVITSSLEIKAHAFSASAISSIENAGGTAIVG